MSYTVLHRFEKEDGSLTEALEEEAFKEKYKEQLAGWKEAEEFLKMLIEATRDSHDWEE